MLRTTRTHVRQIQRGFKIFKLSTFSVRFWNLSTGIAAETIITSSTSCRGTRIRYVCKSFCLKTNMVTVEFYLITLVRISYRRQRKPFGSGSLISTSGIRFGFRNLHHIATLIEFYYFLGSFSWMFAQHATYASRKWVLFANLNKSNLYFFFNYNTKNIIIF